MQHARDRIRELTERRRMLRPVKVIVEDVNAFLRGWAAYFRFGNSAHRDSSVDTPAFRRGRKRTPAEQGRESRFAARADRRPPPTTRRRLVVCRPSGR
ncbi:hypothetical protein FNV64_01980 [Streptomyces sp. S1A1-7]|nr:hypothetical protein FNV64_01980 [Streptomyces sp. S1A1-7]